MTNRVIENWRNQYPESAFWETEAGAAWLKRLVIAVLYSFGMECHVGADKLATFFKLTWAEWMTRQFHRNSSAVEGRNGLLMRWVNPPLPTLYFTFLIAFNFTFSNIIFCPYF